MDYVNKQPADVVQCIVCQRRVNIETDWFVWSVKRGLCGRTESVVRAGVAHVACRAQAHAEVSDNKFEPVRDCELMEFAGPANALWRLCEMHHLYRWTAEQAAQLVELIYQLQQQSTPALEQMQQARRIDSHGRSIFDR